MDAWDQLDLLPRATLKFAINFPIITIADMVKAKLINRSPWHRKLVSVIGGSMGGMQALEWAASFPKKLVSNTNSNFFSTAQNIAFHELGRQAIMADINLDSGNYKDKGTSSKGLSIARMTAHVTYLSEASLTKNLVENYKIKKIWDLVLMLIFRLRVI